MMPAMNIMAFALRKFRFRKRRTSMMGSSRSGQDGQHDDEARAEPIQLLPLVEHHLQRADAQDEQRDPDVVDPYAPARAAALPGRILDQPEDQQRRRNADRQVDEKDPVPAVVVREPAAQRGSKNGGNHHGDAEDREGKAALLRRKRVGQDRLRHRLQPASPRALQYPEQDHQPESRGHRAQDGAHREHGKTDQEEPLAADQGDEPSGEGQHDGVRDEIRGQDPRALVRRGAQAARHVGQGHIGDARVEDLHERREGNDDCDQPGVDAWSP
jgi:hypothetical protein